MADSVNENEELNNDYKSEVEDKKSFFEKVADVFKRQKLLNPGNGVRVQRTGLSIETMMKIGEFRSNTINFVNSIAEKTTDFISKLSGSNKETSVNSLQPEVIVKDTQDVVQDAKVSDEVKENQVVSPIIPKTIVGQTHSKEEIKAQAEALKLEDINVDEQEQTQEVTQEEPSQVTSQVEVGDINITTQPEKKNEDYELDI